ncbi:MAG: methionine synthase [Bacteroidales bacterium]|jgi:5-methyltetrahydrofolate--homocysteine methyltransferase
MIKDKLNERILILDGAMGTMIQEYDSCESINDLLNISQPGVIRSIHRKYIEAGADIIETNTFNANSISLFEYNLADKVYEINFQGAKIAKEEARAKKEKEIFVAGCIGPTSKITSLSSDVNHPEYRLLTFDSLVKSYSEQIRGLIDGGADLLLIETIFDGLNAKAALYAISKVQQEKKSNLPVMVSATVNDKNGRILTGQNVEALYNSIAHYPILSFGLNCSFGAKELKPIIESISNIIPCAISIYPNAGLPNELGEYDESPEITALYIKEMGEEGLINIAGGCCGTTPKHIKAISEVLKGISPRKIPKISNYELIITGLDTIKIDIKNNFTNIGERTNVAGSKKFARLINEKKYEEAARVARKQIEDGSSIIDINMDDAMLDSTLEMETFIRYISNDPDITKAAFMIDSSNWDTIIAGLKNSQGKCIVNSISLKEGETEFLNKAKEIKRLGAAVIVMAFDEKGQATTYKRKIEICKRGYDLLIQKGGFCPSDIIFDVNILSIGTGIEEQNNYAVDFIRAVKWIKNNLNGCHTSGGVSNLSFAFRGNNNIREAMHSVFLYHAIKAGLDMAIVNPAMLQPYEEIEPRLLKCVEDVILNSDIEATDRLIEMAEEIKLEGSDQTKVMKREEWRKKSVENRLIYSLIKGVTDYLKSDITEALTSYSSPIEIIEGPMIKGMETVGLLFGEGKMFLPQIIKSAKVMKEAVSFLQPEIKKANNSSKNSLKRKKIIIATAKGDVHDIGKNILSIVLSCNNLEVIDLGVMVDSRTIIDAIKEYKADFVGISGLITPSLLYMEELCRMLEKERIEIPLLVGGATTSALHTAVKLAPIYNYCVIYGADASSGANIINRIIREKNKYIEEIKSEQNKIRYLYLNNNEKFLTLEKARERAKKFQNESYIQPEQFGKDNLFVNNLPIEKIVDKINWTPFFSFWGFKGTYPEIIYKNEEAQKSYDSALIMLGKMIEKEEVEISLIVKFFSAYSDYEYIILDNKYRLNMDRATSTKSSFESLADFVPLKNLGIKSTVGLFVIKVEDKETCRDNCKDYDHFLRSSICARLTEATAEWMQEQISEGSNVIRPAFGYPACPNHSQKRIVFDILDAENKLGVSLTSSFAIIPTTSLCGMIISHPNAKYIHIKKDYESN